MDMTPDESHKLVTELLEGPLGDAVREQMVRDMIADLRTPIIPGSMSAEDIEAENAWSTSVVEWLTENYL